MYEIYEIYEKNEANNDWLVISANNDINAKSFTFNFIVYLSPEIVIDFDLSPRQK